MKGESKLPDIAEFFQWQKPRVLLSTATSVADRISDDDLMNRAGEFYQKTKEALVASTFATWFDLAIDPVLVKLALANERILDFELSDFNDQKYEYEIVMSLEPDRKPGLEYRNGKQPVVPQRAFSGEPVHADWIAKDIRRKTDLAKKTGIHHRHLLVYQNISGGATDLRQLKALVGDAESAWASMWLISGVPVWGGIALLSNRHEFDWPEAKWYSYVNALEGGQFSGFDFYLQ